jgi:hypothetical protein
LIYAVSPYDADRIAYAIAIAYLTLQCLHYRYRDRAFKIIPLASLARGFFWPWNLWTAGQTSLSFGYTDIMFEQKSMVKLAGFLASLVLMVPLAATGFGCDVKPATAKSLSITCQKHADRLTNIVYQTDVEIEASKSQLQLAEERASQLKELSESGAISSRELDAAQAEVKKAKKDLAAAIARSKQAKKQLITLQNMSACTV